MASPEDVRAVCDHLPRAYEVQVRGRWKYRVGQIVFTSFSHDERDIGFGFPKAEREGLIESDPDTFFLPPPRDLRFGWVCAHLDRLDPGEVRELVVDAWRMCTPGARTGCDCLSPRLRRAARKAPERCSTRSSSERRQRCEGRCMGRGIR